MTHGRASLLIEEARRRLLLNKAIDKSIEDLFCFSLRSKLKRGLVHDAICNRLSLIKSNFICTLINSRMVHKYASRMLHGDTIFDKISFIDPSDIPTRKPLTRNDLL